MCEPEFAISARFYPSILGVFRVVAPLIRFLNEPLLAAAPPTSAYLETAIPAVRA